MRLGQRHAPPAIVAAAVAATVAVVGEEELLQRRLAAQQPGTPAPASTFSSGSTDPLTWQRTTCPSTSPR